jgi:hypothetical protein
MTDWLALTATAATGLFAGAALYVTLVEHPARLACGPMLAVAQFRRSYPRGAALQAPLALIGALAGAVDGVAAGRPTELAAAGLLLGAVVFTLVVIRPVNQRLTDLDLAPDTPEATRLLRRWGHLHLVRTALGLLALLLGLAAGR